MDLVEALVHIKNRAEAEALLAVCFVGQQLDACVRSLAASVEYERLLVTLGDAAAGSRNDYDAALAVSLHHSAELARRRAPHQIGACTKLLENLCRLEVSIQQYGQQNLTISQELQEHAPDVAAHKKSLGTLELALSARINGVVLFSQERLLSTAQLLQIAQQLENKNARLLETETTTSAALEKQITSNQSSQTLCEDGENSKNHNQSQTSR